MIPRYVPILAFLIIVAATSLFQLKYAVVAAEGEIARIQQEIEAEQWRLRTLAVDWAHLARAERLAQQARTVGMAPATLDRVVTAEQIGHYRQFQLARRALPAELPSGEAIELRVKPVTAFRLERLSERSDMLGGDW
jgi:cell division protein FtsL